MLIEVNGWMIVLEEAGEKASIMRRNGKEFEVFERKEQWLRRAKVVEIGPLED